MSSYPHFRQVLKYDNLQFAISLKYITKFEDLNKLSHHIFIIDRKQVMLVTLSTKNVAAKFIYKGQQIERKVIRPIMKMRMIKNLVVFHFALIKNVSKLINRQLENIKNGFVNAV